MSDSSGVYQIRTGKVLVYADDVRDLINKAKRTAVKGGDLHRAAERMERGLDKAEGRSGANL